MNSFSVKQTPIKDLQVIQRNPIGDNRGYLERLFCSEKLRAIINDRDIVQINHTLTVKAGTVRGMHYQNLPHAEMKLISCLRGKIFDVAVDLRKDSPTFLQWHAEILSEKNHLTLVVPEGFAHGFQTLTNNCELIYLHTAAYQPDAEAGFDALDPRLAINWPEQIAERSIRDQQHPKITTNFSGVSL